MSFFALKISDPNANALVNDMKAGKSGLEITQLNMLESSLKVGEYIFVQLGGDRVSWSKGLLGLAKISNKPYEKGYDSAHKNNFKIKLDMCIVLKKVIKREEFVAYADAYDAGGIGPNTKGEQNQAIKSLTDKQAYAILRAMAEKDESIVAQIKAIFDPGICDSIFGEMTCYLKKSLTFDEALKLKNASSDDGSATSSTISDYVNSELSERKNIFYNWMIKQIKPLGTPYAGTPYSESVSTNYANSLEYDAGKLTDYPYEHKNLFYYTDIAEFLTVKEAIKKCPNYPEINKKRINKGFSAAMERYCEFLLSLAADPDDADPEEIVALKNCMEVTLLPRTRKKHPLNFIIYGAPGTGKTYSTAEYALAIAQDKALDTIKSEYKDRSNLMKEYKKLIASGQVVFTTFHQNYGYEEFIQGLRPNTKAEGISFSTVDGVFKKIADLALNDSDKDYVIIIDEINRANISKVFGELITLVEDDKRWGEINELSVTLQSGDPFAVPNNLYIIGTMNSADKSISLIDAALRRRFTFIEQKPDSSLVTDKMLQRILKELNLLLSERLESTDLLVGHSYFMNKSVSDLCDIMNHNIIPLLYEYFYDQRKRVKALLDDVIANTKAPLTVEDDSIGRLRVNMSSEGETH